MVIYVMLNHLRLGAIEEFALRDDLVFSPYLYQVLDFEELYHYFYWQDTENHFGLTVVSVKWITGFDF